MLAEHPFPTAACAGGAVPVLVAWVKPASAASEHHSRTEGERWLVPAEPRSSSAVCWPLPGLEPLWAAQVDQGRNSVS